MTSQHFGSAAHEGWDEDWGDWGQESSNNNNVLKQQQPPPAQSQNFTQPAQTAPIYSPFAYSQPVQQQQPLAAPIQQPISSQQQQYQFNGQNFFNGPGNVDNINNNQQLNQQNVAFNTAPPTSAASVPPYSRNLNTNNNLGAEKQQGYPKNPNQFQPPASTFVPQPQNTFMPSPSTSPMQLPPPPQAENLTDDVYTSSQQQNLPAPPTGSFDGQQDANWPQQGAVDQFQQNWQSPQYGNFNQFSMNQVQAPAASQQSQVPPAVNQHVPMMAPTPPMPQFSQSVTQFTPSAPSVAQSQATPQPVSQFSQSATQFTPSAPLVAQSQATPPPMSQNQGPMPPVSQFSQAVNQFTPPAPSVTQSQAPTPPMVSQFSPPKPQAPPSTTPVSQFSSQAPPTPQMSTQNYPPNASNSPQSFLPDPQRPPSTFNMSPAPAPVSNFSQVPQQNFNNSFNSSAVLDSFGGGHQPFQGSEFAQGKNSRFFENLETSTSEIPSYITSSPNPPHVENVEQVQEPPATENFYPENRERLDDVSTPFTDRHNYLVTGQLSQERDVVTQHHHVEDLRDRMVVGGQAAAEQAAANVPPPMLNHQPTMDSDRIPPTGTETDFPLSYQRQADGEVSVQRPPMPPVTHHQPSATSDRNLYLVAGESDNNNQRVIPGVESDNSLPPTILNPMANLHIQDVDDFSQERNVNVDGMETAMSEVQPREEVIDGANDNSEVVAVVPTPEPEATEVREEAIEGANDEKVDQKPDSSEDSELRALEEKKSRSKGRRGKKYTDDSIDSDLDDDERHRRKESYRKEKRSGRRGEETDGSKYEEDYKRNRDKYKRSSRGKNGEEGGEEKERKKREKYREGGSRRKDYYDDDRRERDRDGERRRRPRYYPDDESYSGRRSQNTSDREYGSRRRSGEKERDRGYYQQYPGYDPYNSYYQQQQYFENLRRTNPQAYYEWYTKYYASYMQQQQQLQPRNDDIAGSMRSGYSSGTEKDRNGSSQFLPGGHVSNPMNTSFMSNNEYPSLPGGFPGAVKELNQQFMSLNYGQGYGYDQDLRDKPTSEVARLTPKKFSCLHGFVRLSNGLLTTIDSMIKIENLPVSDKVRRIYQTFPGPLVRGVSHKKTVIEFCEEKLKVGNASQSLLWSFLILMLRQNGNYTEADVSELLMKNSEEFKASLTTASPAEDVEDSGSEENLTESPEISTATSGVVLHKFRDFLLYGNVNDALDFATENNLWGHALFLASKVDRRQHANVMLKFANKLPYNDPLQTLYQIMSGRMPACVTCLDDKWGDWRPHLAMIISNCTDKPELVKRSILALGDSLAARGDIYASQFCYLLVEPEFGDEGKIALLGATGENIHRNDEAIMMTEVYEYARSLGDENFFIPSLQNFKFLLAANMLDCSLQLKCLLYMEQIAKCIVRQPQAFTSSFISKVYELADRLKFYDPVMEKAYEDNYNNNGLETTEDPKWLQELSALVANESYVVQSQSFNYDAGYTANNYSNSDQQTPVHSTIYNPLSQQQTPVHAPSYEENHYEQQPEVHQAQEAYQQQQQFQPEQNYSYEYTNPVESNQSLPPEQPVYDPMANYQQQQQQQQDYGYGGWDQSQYGSQQPQPTITMGNTSSKNFNDSPKHEPEEENKKSPVKKPQQNEDKSAAEAQKASGGWFGGIFSKLSSNKAKKMILPDDKNPTIIWDEAKKKWVNKDGEDENDADFKPPPKMGEMMGNHMPQMPQPQQSMPQPQQSMPQQAPSPAPAPMQQQYSQPVTQNPNQIPNDATPMPPSAPNMFKMQKGRNLKKSYVDILGNSGKTVQQPKELAPQMDMQFFNPVQQQPQGMQFYNPNDFQ